MHFRSNISQLGWELFWYYILVSISLPEAILYFWYYKMNFNFASRGNPGPYGAGVVIRNYEGHIIKAVFKQLPPDSNNVSEFEALLLGLVHALSLNASNLLIDGDSMVVYNIF